MRASSVEYHAPARFDDLLEVFVRVRGSAGRASPTSSPRTRSAPDDDEQLMVTATQVNVLIDHDDRRTVPVPDSFRTARAASSRAPSCERNRRDRGSRPDRRRRRRRRRHPARRRRALVDPGACSWAGILFVESGELVLGPQPRSRARRRVQVPVVFEGSRVAELAVDGCDDARSSTASRSSSRPTASSAGTPTACPGTRLRTLTEAALPRHAGGLRRVTWSRWTGRARC